MFKYDQFPEIKKAYKERERLRKKSYNLEKKIWADGRGEAEALEANEAWGKYDEEVFALIIFETFKDIKPKLYNERKKKYEKWEKVFPNEWSEFTKNSRGDLLGLVLELGGYGFYRLPEEYYNDVPLFKGFPTPIG